MEGKNDDTCKTDVNCFDNLSRQCSTRSNPEYEGKRITCSCVRALVFEVGILWKSPGYKFLVICFGGVVLGVVIII